MKRHLLRVMIASATCAAMAATLAGCSPKPTATVVDKPAQTESQVQEQESADAQVEATFFTSPLDSETTVGHISFPYSSAWKIGESDPTADVKDYIVFTDEGEYPSWIVISATPAEGELSGIGTGDAVEVLTRMTEDGLEADGLEIDSLDEISMASLPGIIYSYNIPDDETRQIHATATDGDTVYDINASFATGYAGASNMDKDADKIVREIAEKAVALGFGGPGGDAELAVEPSGEFGVADLQIDSKLPGDIETGPSITDMIADLDGSNSAEFGGALIRVPGEVENIFEDDGSLVIRIDDSAAIVVFDGSLEELGVYGTPEDWLEGEYDDIMANDKNYKLAMTQTGFCPLGDVYEVACAGASDSLQVGCEALIVGGDGKCYKVEGAFEYADGDISEEDMTIVVNSAIRAFNTTVFGSAPAEALS